MKARQIQQKFIDFFQKKKHQVVESASLLPKDDQTVLFTTAGMQQFVPYLMGKKHPKGNRLCSLQKCMRTNDIEEVGDNRHLTFFEMLGNWSLGDYFKEEAISWSCEFLTKKLKIDPETIWITVFGGDKDIPLDTESIELWKKQGIPEERIIPVGPKKGGKKNRGDNFWGPAGKTGPCGPCTEMYVYIGENPPKEGQNPSNDEENFIEVWNDVFMEFNQDENGNLTKLTQRNVDTGMGLERIAMVLQQKKTVFETDLFEAVFEKIQDVSHESYPPYHDRFDPQYPITRAMRVIADHIRAATHIIADGGTPSNEGQGYVVRRLLRRAIRFVRKLGVVQPKSSFLKEVAQEHINTFSELYPELRERESVILSTIEIEEENFWKTLLRGESILQNEIIHKNKKNISGEDAFKLYDTYGFPLDVTLDIAREQGVTVDEKGFEQEMQKQKERARKGTGDFFDRKNQDMSTFERLPATKFVGYEKDECEATVLHVEVQGDQVRFALDMTPFYAESGGQIADTGTVSGAEVSEVQKLKNGVYIHIGKGNLKTGESVKAVIDLPRREQIKRHHSLAHLLQAALKEVLGDHVEQQGSLVTEDRTRFDFSHPKAVSKEELRKIEEHIMNSVMKAYPVEIKEMKLEEAKKSGAIALFSEKYGDTVRTVRMGKVSFELCGGTHVANTSEIGAVKILSESSIASGTRRIELVCAEEAQKLFWKYFDEFGVLVDRCKTTSEGLVERINSIFAEKKQLENELKDTARKLVRYESDEFFKLAKKVGAKEIVCEPIPTGDTKKIGAIAHELVERGIDVAALFTHDGSVAVATKEKISARKILEQITEFAGGTGGGGEQFAQGAKVNLEEFQGIRKVVEQLVNI